MYKKILVPLDHSAADEVILSHIEQLQHHVPCEILLFHVADGWAARNYQHLKLKESEEIHVDRAYLDNVAKRVASRQFNVTTHLGMGDPAKEIIRFASEQKCDLIAMGTHGHRFFGDLLLGTTADKVRHAVDIPVLLLRSRKEDDKS